MSIISLYEDRIQYFDLRDVVACPLIQLTGTIKDKAKLINLYLDPFVRGSIDVYNRMMRPYQEVDYCDHLHGVSLKDSRTECGVYVKTLQSDDGYLILDSIDPKPIDKFVR